MLNVEHSSRNKNLLFLVINLCLQLSQCRVLELDDRFKEAKSSGAWLVMFYAPWCGHCKSLEPIWMEVGAELYQKSSVNVARLDCTRYSSLSETFGIRGFPTIKFISGESIHEYRGPRTKPHIVEFSMKAQRPAVTELTSYSSFDVLKKKDQVLFLYVGQMKSNLRDNYNSVASQLFLSLDFYAITDDLMPEVKTVPSILVFKDKTFHEMPEPTGKSQVLKWIVSEQLPSFIELTGVAYGKIKSVGKLFAIFMLPEKDSNDVFSIGEDIALERQKLFSTTYTFCWVEGNKIVNSITYSTIHEPNIVVYNPVTLEYYLFNEEPTDYPLQKNEVDAFLHRVINGEVPAKGGSGFGRQIKIFFSDNLNMIVNLFRDSPIIGSVVLGVPTFVITFLCYCLCTLDDSEAPEDSTDSEEEEEDKEEDLDPVPEYREEIATEGIRKRIKDVDENTENIQAERK